MNSSFIQEAFEKLQKTISKKKKAKNTHLDPRLVASAASSDGLSASLEHANQYCWQSHFLSV